MFPSKISYLKSNGKIKCHNKKRGDIGSPIKMWQKLDTRHKSSGKLNLTF